MKANGSAGLLLCLGRDSILISSDQMHMYRFINALTIFWLLGASGFAETLTFVANPVSGNGWFNADNWFTTDAGGNLVSAGRPPQVNETAIITGTADLGMSGIRVQTLVLTNNAGVTNGTMAAENLQMFSGSSFSNAAVNVLTSMVVGGTNCSLSATKLTILVIAAGSIQPLAPAMASSLILSQGAMLQNEGALSLAGDSQILSGDPPQSELNISPGAILVSSNTCLIRGSATNHLILDNSGTVRVDVGTLTFTNGIDWQCSGGTGEFKAASPASLVLFNTPFSVDSANTILFTGPGTNQWLRGGQIDGVAQIGAIDPATQLPEPGNLRISDSVTGTGTVHITGTANVGGEVDWENGTLSVGDVEVDPGASLRIGGSTGTSRLLSGCVVNNLGNCTVWSGDLGFGQAGAFYNQTGGTFVVQADGMFTNAVGGGTLNNAGTFQKLSTGITQFGSATSTPGPDFNNTGLVDLEGGQLNLSGGSSSGEFHQATNSLLWFWGGTYSLHAGTSFTGTNAVRLSQGLTNATLLLNDALNIPQLEIGLNGIVDASPVAPATPTQFGNLTNHDNGLITNGTFQVQTLEMRDQSVIAVSTIQIGQSWTVSGTNCALSASTLTLPSGSSGVVKPVVPAAGATLLLMQGALIQLGGELALADGAVLTSSTAPQSKLVIQPGALLNSTNGSTIQGSTNDILTVDNSGTVRANAGIFTLANDLDWESSSGIGEFQASAPDAVLLFAGPLNVQSGVLFLFTGAGTNRWLGGGTIRGIAQVGAGGAGSQNPRTGNVEISSSFNGGGSVHVLGGTQAGVVNWSDGTMGMAQMNIDLGATLRMGGPNGTTRQLSGCNLSNSGSCFITGGDFALIQGATINNLAGASFVFQTNVPLNVLAVGSNVSFNNAGTLLSPSGTGVNSIDSSFTNSGKLEILSGNLVFNGPWQQTQGVTILDPGTTLVGTNLTILGGTVSGSGTIAGNLINSAGTISPGMTIGVLSTSPGESYQQGTAASLSVELGGALPGSQYDQFVVGGSAALAGRLVVSLANGFLPVPGETFEVLTCSSLNGMFAGVVGSAPPGTAWVARYSGTNASIVLVTGLDASHVSVSSGSFNLPINTTAGITYVVQFSDAFNPAAWQTIKTLSGDGTLQTVSDPVTGSQRFYRVLLE
jgi:hypothetical protein